VRVYGGASIYVAPFAVQAARGDRTGEAEAVGVDGHLALLLVVREMGFRGDDLRQPRAGASPGFSVASVAS
jgi:hypothetical protein